MYLAEALAQRVEAQRRYSELNQLLLDVAKVQEGDQPAENPHEILTELEELTTRINDLVRRINRTNSVTEFSEGMTLADALSVRDALLKKRTLYSDLADQLTSRQDRYSRSEIKYVATMDAREIRKKADLAAKEYRQLDVDIQRLNWQTELE